SLQSFDRLGGFAERKDVTDRTGEVDPTVPGQLDQFEHVLRNRPVVAADLLLQVAEGGSVGDGQGLVGQTDEHEPASWGHQPEGLFADRGSSGEVEGHRQAETTGVL